MCDVCVIIGIIPSRIIVDSCTEQGTSKANPTRTKNKRAIHNINNQTKQQKKVMMNGEEKEAEVERRRCVKEARHLIPVHVDYHDGCVVLTILYDIGWLQTYFRQHKVREQEDPEHKLRDGLLECEFPYFQFKNNVETDSFGRITYLDLPHIDEEDDDDEIAYYDLPPSVSRLCKLQKIEMAGCRKIPVELGDLPLLTDIKFRLSNLSLFDSIPVGLQLPHVTCVYTECSELPYPLIPFLNLLPNCLKELCFDDLGDATNTIISTLQNCEFKFNQSLTTLCIEGTEMGDDGFENLLFKVVPRFPNLKNLLLYRCDIKSLRGAEKKIKELGLVSDTRLAKLGLTWNDIFYKGLIRSSESEFLTKKLNEIDSRTSSDEKSAALLLLNAFDTISNLGGRIEDRYDLDFEHALRNNLMKRPFTDEGITGTWPSNAALWPFMLEKVYNNSWKVYEDQLCVFSPARIQESRNKKKCATELFHMVRYGPIFAVDQCTQHEITTATTAPATKKQRTKK